MRELTRENVNRWAYFLHSALKECEEILEKERPKVVWLQLTFIGRDQLPVYDRWSDSFRRRTGIRKRKGIRKSEGIRRQTKIQRG